MQNDIVELNRGHYPARIYFTPNRKGLKRLCREIGIDYNKPATPGLCLMLTSGTVIIYVSVAEAPAVADFIGLAAHECMHAVDFILSDIGERCPASEQKAYFIQSLMHDIISAIDIGAIPRKQ